MLNASLEVLLLLGSEDKGILVKSLHQQNQLGQPEWLHSKDVFPVILQEVVFYISLVTSSRSALSHPDMMELVIISSIKLTAKHQI